MRLPRRTRLPLPTAPWSLASLLPVLACTAVLFSQYAFAAKQDSITHQDHNHPRSSDAFGIDVEHNLETYEPDFAGADRSIIGRAGEDAFLENNVPGNENINQSDYQLWTFPSKTLFGPKAPQVPGLPSSSLFEAQNVSATPDNPGERELYISLTTCRQPLARNPDSGDVPDQLQLYVSTSSTNKRPDEKNHDYAVQVEGGFGSLNLSVKTDTYFGVYAPAKEGYKGDYNYQLTASIDGFYASLYNDSIVYFVDSDANSALLYTKNTTNTTDSSDALFQQWMDRPPVFSLFLQNRNFSTLGLQNSICGLQNLAQTQGPPDHGPDMTAAGDGLPKQQFYIKNLKRNSTYYAMVGMIGNSTHNGSGVVGGGGTVWNSTRNFATKEFDNCALLFNMTFCTSVAYAAPANPQKHNTTELSQNYDNYAQSLYQNFTNSLQQIPCDTTSSAQYSLARNCNDCDVAYKEWLCAVTIPRYADISNTATYLQPRALNQPPINSSYPTATVSDKAFSTKLAFNSSRNPMIDTVIQPGPYKELLPCKDLCYNLVRSCPAALQFACPLEGYGLSFSYGDPSPHSELVTCNRPWTANNGAAGLRVRGVFAFYVALSVAFMATAI